MMLVSSLFCLCSQERVEREQYQSVRTGVPPSLYGSKVEYFVLSLGSHFIADYQTITSILVLKCPSVTN